MHRTQTRDRDVGVELRGRQRRVAQQFLHDAQVGAALQQMRGGAVPQPVRARCRVRRRPRPRSGARRCGPAAGRADGRARRAAAPGPSPRWPARDGRRRATPCSAACAGSPNGTVRCLLPLPSTRSSRRGRVDVVDVEAAQLADANSGGVQQLYDQLVAQRERISLLCTGFRGGHGVKRLILPQHRWQGASGLGHLQPGGGIARHQPAARRPRGERLDRRRAPCQRRAGRARSRLRRQPGPQDRQAQAGQSGVGHPLRRESRTATAGRRGRRGGCGRSGHAPARDTRRTPRAGIASTPLPSQTRTPRLR